MLLKEMCEKFNVQGTGLYRIGQLFMLNVVFTYIRTSAPVVETSSKK